jgi:hypothetical protein
MAVLVILTAEAHDHRFSIGRLIARLKCDC